jgi:FkbM family methyltransferase
MTCATHARRASKPDAVVLDVGANIGWWTIPLARRLARGGGRVVAFEPVPANRARLEWAIAANAVGAHVQVAAVALGDQPASSACGSRAKRRARAAAPPRSSPAMVRAHLRVPVVTLDAWTAEHGSRAAT